MTQASSSWGENVITHNNNNNNNNNKKKKKEAPSKCKQSTK
jgi:hypothetical protein